MDEQESELCPCGAFAAADGTVLHAARCTAQFQHGDEVRYVPGHAHGNASHPDAENGIVSSVNAEYVFVRFGSGQQAAACSPAQLLLVRKVQP